MALITSCLCRSGVPTADSESDSRGLRVLRVLRLFRLTKMLRLFRKGPTAALPAALPPPFAACHRGPAAFAYRAVGLSG